MTTPYTEGTISLTNGSAAVVGVGTAWDVELIAGGVIHVQAEGNTLPILAVESDTAITAALNWTGATGTYSYALVRERDAQLARNTDVLVRMLAALEAGTIFKYNAEGDTAGRDTHDNRPKGFAYLDISVNPAELYIKASSAEADWAGPFVYGTGPIGPAPGLSFSPIATGAPGTPASVIVTGSAPYNLAFTIPAGLTGVRWRNGGYSGGTSYLQRDVVRYNGSAWIALQDTIGNAPPVFPVTSNAFWELFVVKGTDGTGTGDIVGPASAADGKVALFDGVTGKLLKEGITLGNAAGKNTGTAAGTVAAGDDPRFSQQGALTLPAIAASKAVGKPVYMDNGIVDGFGGDGGIDAASTGYSLDAANGRVMNAGSLASQVSMWDIGALPASDAGWTGATLRQRLEAARITITGSKFRLRFKGGASGATFSAVYAGHAGSGASFTGNQVPVTFNGGSTTLTLTAGEAEWSDWMTYPVTAGSPFVVAGQCTANGTIGRLNPANADFTFYHKVASTDAATTTASGYSSVASNILWLEAIDVEQASTLQNISLVSKAFEFADYAAGHIKVSGVIEALDALTLNTDVTIDVSRNNGANWSAATMTQLKAIGSRTYFETNSVSVTGQPAGDDIMIRYKTLNLKRCYVHGLRTEVLA